MQLATSSWPEIEAYLGRSTGLIIPIGSIEQHGPNGFLGTDALCPEIIAREAGDASDILIAPTFNVGVAQHHLGFAGTITLRPSTMIAVLQDWIGSLTRHGFTRLYFLNGHGGNIATVQAAFAEIYAGYSLAGERAPFACTLRNWWELGGVDALSRELYPTGMGSHATPPEVSVTYYGYPDAAKEVAMSPKIAPEGPIRDAADYRTRFPDGRIGSDPSQACAEDGAKLVTCAKDALIADARAFFAKDAMHAQAAAE